MSQDLQTAFTLLIIGMLAVFVILSLVVASGRGLIYLVDKYWTPAEEDKLTLPKNIYQPKALSKAKLAAITAAVEAVSHGQAHIVKIEKE